MIPALAGGETSLTTDNPSIIHVPVSVTIRERKQRNQLRHWNQHRNRAAYRRNVFASAGGVDKIHFR